MKLTSAVRRFSPKVCACLLAILSQLAGQRVLATDNYAYRADEYVVISGGSSPDGRWSIAAHGDKLYGYDGFQLCLMREPAHKRVAPLPTDGHLDTGPVSNVALWAPDSQHVAILYRTDRHVLDVRLFRVADGKVHPIKVPSLVSTVSHGRLNPDESAGLYSRYYQFKWQDAKRFALEEFDGFHTDKSISQTGIETYLELEKGANTLASFSAGTMCELTAVHEIKLSKIKPLPDQARTIVYSPHLRFDPEHGLYVTETTMSSLEAQKARK